MRFDERNDEHEDERLHQLDLCDGIGVGHLGIITFDDFIYINDQT